MLVPASFSCPFCGDEHPFQPHPFKPGRVVANCGERGVCETDSRTPTDDDRPPTTDRKRGRRRSAVSSRRSKKGGDRDDGDST